MKMGTENRAMSFQEKSWDVTLVNRATMAWAANAVFGRRVMRNRPPVSATALSNFRGLPPLIVAAVIELRHLPLNPRPETILGILHICNVPGIIGYWCWNRAVRVLNAGGAVVFYSPLPL